MTRMVDGQKGQGLLYGDLTYRIRRCAFEVHTALGPGFLEATYEAALTCEFELEGISHERQLVVPVHYKGSVVSEHRLDLVMEGKVVVELKAVTELTDLFKQQLLSYLKASNLRLGLLMNFGAPRVQIVRIIN